MVAPMMEDENGEALAEPRHPQMVFKMKLPKQVPPLSVVRACRPNS
jgi:putative protease